MNLLEQIAPLWPRLRKLRLELDKAKDARGHGSEARGGAFAWQRNANGSGHSLTSGGRTIGNVETHWDGKRQAYKGSYNYDGGAGGDPKSSWSIHASVGGAKRAVERGLSNFWEPPTITKAKV